MIPHLGQGILHSPGILLHNFTHIRKELRKCYICCFRDVCHRILKIYRKRKRITWGMTQNLKIWKFQKCTIVDNECYMLLMLSVYLKGIHGWQLYASLGSGTSIESSLKILQFSDHCTTDVTLYRPPPSVIGLKTMIIPEKFRCLILNVGICIIHIHTSLEEFA